MSGYTIGDGGQIGGPVCSPGLALDGRPGRSGAPMREREKLMEEIMGSD